MKRKENGVRHYPANYRMVWITCILIFLIVTAECIGWLYEPIKHAQENLLGDALKKHIVITGTVTESKKGQGYFFIQTESGANLYVMIPYAYYDVETETSTVWYPAGAVLEIEGELSVPNDARNPGGFDETKWLLSKKTGLKLNAEHIQILSEPQGVWHMVYELHNHMEHILYRTLPKDYADLSMALLTGAKHRLSDDFYTMTQSMGIAHIFAVSGLHVGIIGSVVLWFFHAMGWMRSWAAFVILAMGLGLYCMLAGLPASALRAAAMILLSALAMRLYRPPNAINFLAFAAFILLLDNPFLLWNAGFQLSFGVTLALLLFVQPIQQKLQFIRSEKVRGSVAVVLSAWLGSVPLTAWHFYTFSPMSPLYNFVLVPLVTLAVPLLLAGLFLSALLPSGMVLFLFPAELVLWILETGTMYLYTIAERVQWNIGQPHSMTMLLYVVFLVLLWYWLYGTQLILSPKYNRVGLLMLSVFIVILSIPSVPDADELLYLDTGQGSCAMLRTKAGETVLFDTGAQTQELASVLAWYGVNHIDAVILSHGDIDHTNGLSRVLDTVSVEQIFMEQTQMQRDSLKNLRVKAIEKHINCIAIESSTIFNLKNHHIVLEPYRDSTDTTNAAELTAMLYYKGGAACFPGDLGISAIQQFVAKQEQITIWTVPHHGSRYSGNAYVYRLLQQKGARYAVISAGQDNHYGHPHEEVLRWIKNAQIVHYSTAEQGAVLFILP